MSHCLKSRACVLFIFVTQQPMQCWNMVGTQSVCWMNIPFPTPHTQTHWSSTILACFLVGGTLRLTLIFIWVHWEEDHTNISPGLSMSLGDACLKIPCLHGGSVFGQKELNPHESPPIINSSCSPRSFQQEHKCQQNETISTAWSKSK